MKPSPGGGSPNPWTFVGSPTPPPPPPPPPRRGGAGGAGAPPPPPPPPCHRSQSRSLGARLVGGGKLAGGTNQGGFGRLVQVTTSVTSPTTPAATHSLMRRMPSRVWPWEEGRGGGEGG